MAERPAGTSRVSCAVIQHMPTLHFLFPDVQILLALAPEELAGVLIELASPPPGRSPEPFSLNTFIGPSFRPNESGYPQGMRRQVILAVAEAMSWLISQGLVIEDPEQPASWLLLTRRGQTVRTRADVSAFRKGKVLPTELLQPILVEKVWPQFLRGDHDVAVFQAFKEVEVAVRKVANKKGAGYPNDLVGTKLMRSAFHTDNGPLRDAALVTAEREAEMHLFSGAIGHAKNPASHRDVGLSPEEAARLIVFASHLLSIVEQRSI